MTAIAPEQPGPTLRLAGRRYPVVGPSIRDPRLHIAAVIMTIHVLGQVGLDFHISIAQILIAIGTCAAIEVVWTFRHEKRIVWPASAMLTGSGVALIFRVVGTRHGDWWSLNGWYLFAGVAALALATKYLLRYRRPTPEGPQDTPLFNPSNVSVVLAFVVLGSNRVEPLDFWWGPMSVWLVMAYGAILIGGVLITRRLKLLAMATTFWVVFAALTAVLASSGHCFTAQWSLTPVCGAEFWRIVVLSPEVLIFLFFMITDPRTGPTGARARTMFAALVAATSVVLLAPWGTEFGAKVGLLAGLVVMCAARPLLDRRLPVDVSVDAQQPKRVRHVLVGAAAFAGVAVLVLVAGTGAREEPTEIIAGPVSVPEIDPADIPGVEVTAEVDDLESGPGQAGADQVALELVQNLQLEAQAIEERDITHLDGVSTGLRSEEIESQIDAEEVEVPDYHFDQLTAVVVYPDGAQAGARFAIEALGSVDLISYDRAGLETARTTEPCALVFVMKRGSDRWVITDSWPIEG
jgi:hypothetical protein